MSATSQHPRDLPAHDLRVTPIACLRDNYAYLIEDRETGTVGVVDPSEAKPVLDVLDARGLRLSHIFNTHHHPDHIGGNAGLLAAHDCMVIAPRANAEQIDPIDHPVGDEDQFHFGHQGVHVIAVPGHTAGHVAFWFPDADAVFTGDTLFSLGCGRLFEGTPDQMWHSMLKLRKLPAGTHVYCGHEYTQANARFAETIEPENEALSTRAREVDALRAEGRPTIPSTIWLEARTNPFLRADRPELAAALGMSEAEPVTIFAEIRSRKDKF